MRIPIDGPSRDDLAAEMAAFANTHDGVLLLGVDDKSRGIVGIPVDRLDQGRSSYMEKRGDGVPIIMNQSVELSGKEPVYRLIDDAELLLSIFSADLIQQDEN